MKKYFEKFALLALLLTALFVVPANAQSTTDNLTIDSKTDFHISYNNVTLDSAETIYSQPFRIDAYNEDLSAYPLNLERYFQSADSINISAYWLINSISLDSNSFWIVVDTLFTATTATATQSTADLNEKLGYWNKIKIVNNTGSSANKLNFGAILPKRSDR